MSINVCTETLDAIANGPYTDGDGTEDITASINEVFANAGNPTYSDPYIPVGHYLISSEIVTPYVSGLSLRGSGTYENENSNEGGYTLLEYTGSTGEAVFKLRANHMRIGGFCIDGGELADQGILMTRDGLSGLGTGKSTLGPFSIWDCEVAAIQIGASIGDNNCDECEWLFVEVDSCPSAVYFRSTNALGHHFQKLRTYLNIDNCVRARGGGKSLFTTAQVVSAETTVFKGEHESGGFGPNQANFVFDNLITDSQASDSLKLVDSNARYLDLTFRNWVHSNSLTDSYAGTLVTIRGMTQVLFDHCRSNFNGLTGTYLDAWGTPNITFLDCVCGVNPSTKISGDLNYRMIACKDNRGEYYDDYPARTNVYIDGELSDTSRGSSGIVDAT